MKLLFTMRDPIDRAWSTVVKQLARFRDRPMETFSDDEVLDKIERQGEPMSRYVEDIERWESFFPPERFFYGFYEDVLVDPAGLVNRVCEHVGAPPHPALDPEALARRVNDTMAYRTEIPFRWERLLAERLIEPTERLAKRFAGPTEAWVERMQVVLSRPAAG